LESAPVNYMYLIIESFLCTHAHMSAYKNSKHWDRQTLWGIYGLNSGTLRFFFKLKRVRTSPPRFKVDRGAGRI